MNLHPEEGRLLLYAADDAIRRVVEGLIHAMQQKKMLPGLKGVNSSHAAGFFDTLLYRLEATVEALVEQRKIFPWTHVLVVADRRVSGKRIESVVRLEDRFRDLLRRRSPEVVGKLVVIDPEVEIWLWGVGWNHWREALERHTGKKFPPDRVRSAFQIHGTGKPQDPKDAIRQALRILNIRKKSPLYGEVARCSSRREWERCQSPSFRELYQTLMEWFA